MPKPTKGTKEERKRAMKEAIEKDERFSQKAFDPVCHLDSFELNSVSNLLKLS